jgi:hypothetical protein
VAAAAVRAFCRLRRYVRQHLDGESHCPMSNRRCLQSEASIDRHIQCCLISHKHTTPEDATPHVPAGRGRTDHKYTSQLADSIGRIERGA